MDLEKFFELVKRASRVNGVMNDEEKVLVDAVLADQRSIIKASEDNEELLEDLSKLQEKTKKLEDDNFKYRERARNHDKEVDAKVTEAVEAATKPLNEKIVALEAEVASAKERETLYDLEKELRKAGIAEDLIPKAVKLIEDEHYKEEKSKDEDGKETVSRVFDVEKFKEDNEIFFAPPRTGTKGIGLAGSRPPKPSTTRDIADNYVTGTYVRPDRKVT